MRTFNNCTTFRKSFYTFLIHCALLLYELELDYVNVIIKIIDQDLSF